MDLALRPADDEPALWRRLREEGDEAARAALLRMHLPYAKVIAAHFYGRRFSDDVEFGDFLQYASLGMLEALDRFDPARGVQFRTFAARRMQGAILNGLERLTEKHQQIAARQRLRNERLHDLQTLAGADAAGNAPDEPAQLLRFVTEVGIGLALCWMLEGTGMVETAEGASHHPFYRGVALAQLRARLLHAVDGLPAQEKTVVRSHYLQGIPFDRVAESLSLTKGRISQIHKQALLHLRAAVREDADWDTVF
ncbi:sigma-70 family RNA polymerase sigma factor [Ramlibacter sp. USB13]|uniref:Sigma-70 family RNA polymerase sigma factor n=1 Tax=Ramlibacter cellulosilyticus TaxID=2764187 RepID=A0A923SCM4_9BURK|nr:sigma-70 family RNA polymerase sigma factor [Ramlibacter cellulosilyticus]MBC5785110.1 sigma-70 family RNA polymerase sigma factor [Ramlibacter cellulosilyticus]